jgi:membrane protein DedA with SNARE-associated domain
MMEFIRTLTLLPAPLLLLLLGMGAAIENVVPPVPADTFVVVGSFLAARGSLSVWAVFGVTWAANVGSAMAVYGAGRRHGLGFFRHRWGRWILNRRQLAWLRAFYSRWGTWAIFMSRFLPGIRAVVPVFAGVSRMRVLPVLVPMAIASAIWYGGLVWAGALAGRNLEAILAGLSGVNRVLGGVALVLALLGFLVWTRTRKGRRAGNRRGADPGPPRGVEEP